MISRIRSIFMIPALASLLLAGCGKKELPAKEEADLIMANLTDYKAIKGWLSEEHFPTEETEAFLGGINNHCDWKNRRGGFVDTYMEEAASGPGKMAFIYEYFLNCDSLRFILWYAMHEERDAELLKIGIEPLEAVSPLIRDPSKQLLQP